MFELNRIQSIAQSYTPQELFAALVWQRKTLLAMANYRPMPETSIIHFIPYPADTLYLLTENRDTTNLA